MEVCSLVGREVKAVTEVKRVHKQPTNKQTKKKKADDIPETHTIKKMFKFKLVNTNVQSQINMQESARLSMYLVCLEIDYFK